MERLPGLLCAILVAAGCGPEDSSPAADSSAAVEVFQFLLTSPQVWQPDCESVAGFSRMDLETGGSGRWYIVGKSRVVDPYFPGHEYDKCDALIRLPFGAHPTKEFPAGGDIEVLTTRTYFFGGARRMEISRGFQTVSGDSVIRYAFRTLYGEFNPGTGPAP